MGAVLAGFAGMIVLLDLHRILEIGPVGGFRAATDVGLYVTLAGAMLGLIGCASRALVARGQDSAAIPSLKA